MNSNAKLSDSDLPVEYRHSGTSGHADSTVSGKASAMSHFNDFLQTKRMQSFTHLREEEVCSVQLWQQYGTYVSEFARRKHKVIWSVAHLVSFPLISYILHIRSMILSNLAVRSST